jgi:hypothetical protein
MEVRQVRDPDPYELGWESVQGTFELVEPHPAGLEVAPAERAGGNGPGADRDRGQHRGTL